MKIYKASKGASYGDDTAQVLGEVLEQLGDEVTPKMLVKAAKPKASPIHKLFEWNNDAAAERYRLVQARMHINHLEIIIVVDDAETQTRAYHNVRVVEDEAERSYVHMDAVVRSEGMSAQVVAKAVHELQGWQRRYQEYQAIFGGVFREIERVKRPKRRKAKAI